MKTNPFRVNDVQDAYLCTKYRGFDVIWAQAITILYPDSELYATVLSIPALLAARSGADMQSPELLQWSRDLRLHLSTLMESSDFDLVTPEYVAFLVEEAVQQLKESNVRSQ